MEYIPGYDEWKTTPPEYDEPEPYYCPVCGKEAEIVYEDGGGDIVGCNCCLKERYVDDMS